MEKSKSPDSGKKMDKSKRVPDYSRASSTFSRPVNDMPNLPDLSLPSKTKKVGSEEEMAHQDSQRLTRCTRFRLSADYELSICNCKHIMRMTIGDRHSVANPQRWLCNTCYSTESVWACLSCPNVACGRYIHEHALNHYEESRHPLVIDVNELYVYCYECEEYVLNDNKSGDIKVLRETLQAIRYQNFTGTTRSGHTLRTATISADEDVQMRRRLQQQQLDRDDRLFTAIWHSRFVRQRKAFHAWLHYVKHRDDRRDDVSNVEDENVVAPSATEVAGHVVVEKRPPVDGMPKNEGETSSPSCSSVSSLLEATASTSGPTPMAASAPPVDRTSSTLLKQTVKTEEHVKTEENVKTEEIEEKCKEISTASSKFAHQEPSKTKVETEISLEATRSSSRDESLQMDESTTSSEEAAFTDKADVVIVITEKSLDEESVSSKQSVEGSPVKSENDDAADATSVEDSAPPAPKQRPKRVNAGSRYHEIMTRLSHSDNEPSRKRACPNEHINSITNTADQLPLRRSMRLQQLQSKRRTRPTGKRRKSNAKKSSKTAAPRGAKKRRVSSAAARGQLKKPVPPRTRVYRRIRATNGTKSLYDSVPNRAVTSLIPGVTGLRNLGNTCYLNSIIQVLGHLQKFRRCLLAVRDLEVDDDSARSDRHKVSPSSKLRGQGRRSTIELYECQTSINKRLLRVQEGLNGGNEDDAVSVSSDQQTPFNRQRRRLCGNAAQNNPLALCHELHDLYHIMWSGKWKLVSPYHFLSSVWRLIPSFRGYSQQDAQEFLCELLDKIVSELDRRHLAPRNPTGLLSSRISRVVHAVFEGRLHSKVRCLECKRVSSTIEPFWDLSLEFPQRYHSSSYSWKSSSNKACTLQEMLDKFTEAEKLDGGRVYNCSPCNATSGRRGRRVNNRAQKFTEAEKQIKVNDLPQILRFHLKRFRWSGRNHREKITVQVNFPAELDMRAHCWRDESDMTSQSVDDDSHFMYDLSAVVIHHGRGFGSGHYTAYCWNDVGKFWVHCNDSNLELCSIDDVMESQAYILFYSQRGIDPHPHLFTPPSTPDLSPPPSPPFSNAAGNTS